MSKVSSEKALVPKIDKWLEAKELLTDAEKAVKEAQAGLKKAQEEEAKTREPLSTLMRSLGIRSLKKHSWDLEMITRETDDSLLIEKCPSADKLDKGEKEE